MLPADNNLDPFGLRRAAEAARRGPSHIKFLFVFVGLAVVTSFLVLASIAPQIGDKLGTLSVKKQTQVSRAATLPNPQGPCLPYGDVDASRTVDSVDALKILRYANRLPVTGTFNRSYADVDADGNISKADGQMVLDYIAGSRSTFPVCPIVKIPIASVSNVQCNQFTLNWSAVSGATNYQIESVDNGGAPSQINGGTGSRTSWTYYLDYVLPNHTYILRVKANVNGIWGGWSNQVTVRTPSCPTSATR